MPRFTASITVPAMPMLTVEFLRRSADVMASLVLHARADSGTNGAVIASAGGIDARAALRALVLFIGEDVADAVGQVAAHLP